MYFLSSDIRVGQYTFKGVVNVEIQSSWEELTDTCIITIPRKLRFKNKNIAVGQDPLFKRGDKVEVNLGWNGNNSTRFTGYVRTIKIGTPITIICEDEAFLLKQGAKTVSFENPTLKQLLDAVLPTGTKYHALGMNLGQFRIKNATPAKVLDELRRSFGLFSFFINKELYVGFPYPPETPNKVWKFAFQKNIISDNLDYRRKEDIKVKVKAISMKPDNSKIEVEVGDSNGDLRTFHHYNLSEKELRKVAEEDLKRIAYSGWKGDFLTFGQQPVIHGDIVELEDDKLDRKGRYLVKKVVVSFGVDGFRRTIYLDRQE